MKAVGHPAEEPLRRSPRIIAARGGPARALLAAALLAAGWGHSGIRAGAADAAPTSETVGGVEFVRLPGGCFEMGDLDVGVVGTVCLDPFAIGRLEVTNAQFRAFDPGHDSGRGLAGDGQPAVGVSWREAAAYAEWLGRKTGRRLRLPTEAEWEFAARAGTTSAWPWGANEALANRFANLRHRAGSLAPADPFPATAPVGSLRPNGFGLFDMVGNASEWVADGYAAGPDRYGGGLTNPRVEPTGPLRVRRGGSFDDPPRLARAAVRDFYAADLGVPQTGFRLVLE